MTDHTHMVATVHRYFEGFERGDGEFLAGLFADDASVEDPVGSAPLIGKDAIQKFYKQVASLGAKLKLTGPIRTAGTYAAFPFECRMKYNGAESRIEIIDVFQFNAEGKIKSMQAFFGPENVHKV